jgi:hypothetical protein
MDMAMVRRGRRMSFMLVELDEGWCVCAGFDGLDGVADGVRFL